MRVILSLLLATVIAMAALFAGCVSTWAAELKVMSSGAYKAALDEIVPLFEKASGHKIVVQYDAAAVVVS
jgi:molybdate transport system substrate-binding protein